MILTFVGTWPFDGLCVVPFPLLIMVRCFNSPFDSVDGQATVSIVGSTIFFYFYLPSVYSVNLINLWEKKYFEKYFSPVPTAHTNRNKLIFIKCNGKKLFAHYSLVGEHSNLYEVFLRQVLANNWLKPIGEAENVFGCSVARTFTSVPDVIGWSCSRQWRVAQKKAVTQQQLTWYVHAKIVFISVTRHFCASSLSID